MKDETKMLSRFISEGMKLTLQAADSWGTKEDEEAKTYSTIVYEIVSEDCLEIQMPMEKAKLILLPVGKEYEVCFYAGAVLYKCFARVEDRYKRGTIYLLLLELTSNLRKYQRREYYRFSCILEMLSRNLEEQEIEVTSDKNKDTINLQPGLPLKRSVIVDISGGGLRFISTVRYEAGSLILCTYNLYISGQRQHYEVVGKVLAVKEMENKRGNYEHRVEYYNMDVKAREAIIKYIFEEERKNRNK